MTPIVLFPSPEVNVRGISFHVKVMVPLREEDKLDQVIRYVPVLFVVSLKIVVGVFVKFHDKKVRDHAGAEVRPYKVV